MLVLIALGSDISWLNEEPRRSAEMGRRSRGLSAAVEMKARGS